MKSVGLGRRRRYVAALLTAVVWGSSNAYPQTAKPTDYQVKAAYLARFVKFIEWPDNPSSLPTGGAPADEPFPVCVLGQDPFGPALDAALAGETFDRHPLVPRRVTNAREAGACRVVFMGEDDRTLRKDLAALEGSKVLTVSDQPDFLKRGGMIQFVLQGNPPRVRFEVNLMAAKKAGLNLSSELLKVAADVRRNP
jgi:YfiR/HmsC-like